ncbi:hypothetical protein [Halomonas sp. 328]|uniref:hypothetical protein n=1 Tax=Halomonas sp. 328 TaxID=2776704 RepID=UPI0018A77107|nr:hypothetical protein [Halomonas sp. 328]MBF8221089.1 hypothetical protein [Halomonas sp. 328]
MAKADGFRYRWLAMAGVALVAAPLMTTAGQHPAPEPLAVGSDGEHYRYRMHTVFNGEDLYWDITQGPDITRIAPDEATQSRVSGFVTLYTGPAVGSRAHEADRQGEALLPQVSAPGARPPLEYEDVFDNLHRTDEVRVVVQPTGERRELAGRDAKAYALAVVSDKSRHHEDEWRSYHTVNLGTLWAYDDLPFSPAPLQLSPYIFDWVFAPNSGMAGLDDYYQARLIEALEPLGMLAGARMRDFQVSTESLAMLEAQGWQPGEDEPPGQALGPRFELLITELATDADELDYAALEGMVRLDGATLE